MMESLRQELTAYARSAAEALYEIHPDAVSIVWKGSAYKPWDSRYDFIPGLSDLDLHVYRPGGLTDAFAVRRRLFGAVGSPPAATPLQVLILDTTALPQPWTLLEGTYEVLVGDAPPVPAATSRDMRDRDREDLVDLDRWLRQVASGVVDRTDAELWEFLKRVRWMFPSILTRVATVAGEDPVLLWRMNRTGVLAHTADIAAVAGVRAATIAYVDAAIDAAESRAGRDAERAILAGYQLLQIAEEWVRSAD